MPYRVDQPSTTIPVFLVVVEYANYGCTDMKGRLWRPGDKCPEGDYEHIPPRFYALPGILSGRPIRDLVEASMKGELEHVHDPRPRSQWSRCRYTGKITECECPTCKPRKYTADKAPEIEAGEEKLAWGARFLAWVRSQP